jgi:hypothetical protein
MPYICFTVLNAGKAAASFLLATFHEANCRHWNGDESLSDAHVVVTGMPWIVSDGCTGRYTTNGEPDPL